MAITIINAICNKDLTVDLFFNDNSHRKINIGNFIKENPHPQYNKYLQWKHFKTATIEYGNVTWGKNWDLIFPVEQLHKGQI